MAQSKVNLPPVGTGDTGPIPVAVKKISTGEAVQQIELGTAVEGGALTPIANANPLPISDAGGSLTVDGTVGVSGTVTTSGTVTANIGTSGSLALDATLTGGTQKSKLVDTGGTNVAAVSAAGRLSVDASGVAVPVTDNSGSLTVDAPVGTPAFVRLSDGSSAITTLPVSAASLPLPTGAATAAKQPALGTAGAASTDVLTIQGIASGVAIPVSGSFSGTTDLTATKTVGALNDAAQITGMNGLSVAQVDIQASFSATLIFEGTVDGTTWVGIPKGTITTSAGGLIAASQVTTTAGNWTVPIAGLSGFRVRCSVYGSGSPVVTVRASAAAGVVALNQALPPGSNAIGTVVLGAGSAVAGKFGIDQTTPGTTNFVAANITQVAGSAISQGHGTAATAIRVELPTDSTGVIGVTDNAGSLTVDNAGTFAVQAATELATGLTTFYNGALSNTKTAVKASAGKVYGWMIHNPAAATTFIQVWNVAIGSITVGTTAATWEIPIPAGASANVFTDRGITHSAEINIAATTTAGGSTAPATAAVCSIFYI